MMCSARILLTRARLCLLKWSRPEVISAPHPILESLRGGISGDLPQIGRAGLCELGGGLSSELSGSSGGGGGEGGMGKMAANSSAVVQSITAPN